MSVPQSAVYMSAEAAKGLAIIDKATIVQEKGAPAYVMMGSVGTKEIIHAPFEEEDKNLPTEIAQVLSPLVRKVYQGDPRKISPSQVTLLLRHLGIDKDNRHCILERKLRRKYITRLGLKTLQDFIQNNPEEALKAFGSRASLTRYGHRHSKEIAKDGSTDETFRKFEPIEVEVSSTILRLPGRSTS